MGTHTSEGEQNYLMIAEARPFQTQSCTMHFEFRYRQLGANVQLVPVVPMCACRVQAVYRSCQQLTQDMPNGAACKYLVNTLLRIFQSVYEQVRQRDDNFSAPAFRPKFWVRL